MSYSERMRYLEQENNKYVARNKCRDSSELTLMRQAKATSVAAPQTVSAVYDQHTNQIVPPYQYASQASTIGVFTGVGTSNDYSAIRQAAQGCAICSDPDPVTNPYIILPTPCYNRNGFPFVQQNVSTPYICKTIGKTGYFRQPPACAASNNIYYTPSG